MIFEGVSKNVDENGNVVNVNVSDGDMIIRPTISPSEYERACIKPPISDLPIHHSKNQQKGNEMNSFFRLDYEGRSSVGSGALAFVNGKIAGLDVAGLVYIGRYEINGNIITGSINIKNTSRLPVELVQGNFLPPGRSFDVPFSHEAGSWASVSISLNTPFGDVRVRVTEILNFTN